MKIKDIISELQRYSPDENLILKPDSDGSNVVSEFDIEPVNYAGNPHASVAIIYTGCEHQKELHDMEESAEKTLKKLDRAHELAEELETSIHQEDSTDASKSVKELLEVTDEN